MQLYRTMELNLERGKDESVSAVLSSEFPVERSQGIEILDHSPGSVDLSRGSRGYPLLFSHDRDVVIGRAENVRLDGRKLRGELRPARNARAKEIWGDIEGGILRDVSISYIIDENSIKRDGDQYRVMKWSLLETSIVSIPGDPTTGIGRGQNQNQKGVKNKMEKCSKCGNELKNNICETCQRVETDKEKIRCADIISLGQKMGHADKAVEYIREGKPFQDFANYVIADARAKLDRIDIRVGNPAEGRSQSVSVGGPVIGASYEKLFGKPKGMDGYRDAREFLTTVQTRSLPPAGERAMSMGVGTAGGYAVPPEMAGMWLDGLVEDEIVFGRAKVYPMQSDTLPIPAWAIGSHSDNFFGGITASWRPEGIEASEQAPKLRQITLTAHKLFLYVPCTNELLSDAPTFQGDLNDAFKQATSYFRDSAFLTGNGVGVPLGILNADCTIDVTRNTASDVKLVDLATMVSKMAPGSFNRAVWVVSLPSLVKLLQLSISIGTAGGQYLPLMNDAGKLVIFTRPVLISEKAKNLGTKGDVMFCDFSQYAIGLKSDMRLEYSRDELFKRDMTSFRLTTRFDGVPLWNEPLTLEDGINTVSPFVVLN